MKIAITLGLLLILSGGTALKVDGSNSAQRYDDFQSFWQRFKTAVISQDIATVATLSKFPIGMSFPATPIRNRLELRRRFREVFVDQFSAAQCFARTEPSVDTEAPELFTEVCRNDNGSDAAAYEFEHTKSGWRFTHFQVSTTCRCR